MNGSTHRLREDSCFVRVSYTLTRAFRFPGYRTDEAIRSNCAFLRVDGKLRPDTSTASWRHTLLAPLVVSQTANCAVPRDFSDNCIFMYNTLRCHISASGSVRLFSVKEMPLPNHRLYESWFVFVLCTHCIKWTHNGILSMRLVRPHVSYPPIFTQFKTGEF
jgi:hypothetical protein